jgi:hypothetical protein
MPFYIKYGDIKGDVSEPSSAPAYAAEPTDASAGEIEIIGFSWGASQTGAHAGVDDPRAGSYADATADAEAGNFFDGRLLTAQDTAEEQTYGRYELADCLVTSYSLALADLDLVL